MHRHTADRLRLATVVVGAVALVAALITVGWMMVRPSERGSGTVAATGEETPTPTAEPTTSAAPTTKAAPTRTRRPSPTRQRVRPTPTRKPPKSQLPPPPPKPKPDCTPRYTGPKAPFADVRDALVQAAGREYWQGVQLPPELNGELPTITVPVTLIKAVAWQESGWQSTIVACDGGIGTMQVMPGTAQFVNQRFGTDYNVNTLAGNTSLGAAYLEWLTMYFGLYYFGAFELDATAEVGRDGARMRLRDVVISAYNVGPAALEDDDGALSIPNRSYVNNVVALITECPCSTY